MKNLKNYVSICCILISCCSVLNAQETDKKIYYGFTYGWSANSVFNHVNKIRLGVGFSPVLISHFVQFNMKDDWSLMTELDYVHKGPTGYTIDYITISCLYSDKALADYPNISLLGGLYTGHIFEYKYRGTVFEPDPLKKYDLGVEVGVDYVRELTDKLDLYFSPRVEVGLIRFSYSNHFSVQVKGGIRF